MELLVVFGFIVSFLGGAFFGAFLIVHEHRKACPKHRRYCRWEGGKHHVESERRESVRTTDSAA